MAVEINVLCPQMCRNLSSQSSDGERATVISKTIDTAQSKTAKKPKLHQGIILHHVAVLDYKRFFQDKTVGGPRAGR